VPPIALSATQAGIAYTRNLFTFSPGVNAVAAPLGCDMMPANLGKCSENVNDLFGIRCVRRARGRIKTASNTGEIVTSNAMAIVGGAT
jgi:hypothetical protein